MEIGTAETPNEVGELDSPIETETETDVEETAHETTARVLRELKGEDAPDGGEGSKPEAHPTAAHEGSKDTEVAQTPEDAFDPDLQPPERFNARGKQLFHNLPKGIKRELNRFVREQESSFGRERQGVGQEREELRSIRDAYQPYVAEWGKLGINPPQAIAELAATQRKITQPDLDERTREFAQLAIDCRIPREKLAAVLGLTPNGGAPMSVEHDPVVQGLRSEIENLKSQIHGERDQRIEHAANLIGQEIDQVVDERDPATGNYRYPGLHEEVFLESAKRRVSELVRENRGLSYGDAFRRAHDEIASRFGFNPRGSNQASTPRPPAPAAINTQQRAHAAAQSVRGRSASVVANGHSAKEPPPEVLANAKATTEWVLHNLRRGG